MRHDLAGPLCQWAETAAAGGGCGGGAGAAEDLGGAVLGDFWGLQCGGGGA